MSAKVILVWFRNDLRTHDHEVLVNAVNKSDFIIPVYIFDPRYYAINKYDFQNTGEIRRDFIAQNVYSLKSKLQSIGSDLLTFEGYPEEIIPHLAQKYAVKEVYHHREVATRETKISEAVETALWNIKVNLRHFIGHTLYHKEDLPFPIPDIPSDYNTFKKKINKECKVRLPIAPVDAMKIPPHLEKTDFPAYLDIDDLIYGEENAFKVLDLAIAECNSNPDVYYMISPYIALGVLSPIYVYHYLKAHQNSSNKKGIEALIDCLFKRDYFRFMLKKYPNYCFINKTEYKSIDQDMVDQWIKGETDNNLVNNLIKKLNETGYLNEQERVITSAYLIYELKQNWLVGAAWFEQQLIDYAPATIYGYWAHCAGQGTSIKNNKTEEDWIKIKEQYITSTEIV